MKKFIVIAFLALVSVSTIKAQILQNQGQFFVFKNQSYQITEKDVVQIAYAIDQKVLKTGIKRQLSNGEEFTPYYPEKWEALMSQILTKVHGSPIASVYQELSKGVIVPWDDNISTSSTNYGINMAGGLLVNKSYKGAPGVRVMTYEGYPVLKTGKPCLNPNDPNIPAPITVVPTPTPTPTPAPVPVPAPQPTPQDEYRAQYAAKKHSEAPAPAHSSSTSESNSYNDVEYDGGWSISLSGMGGSSNSCNSGYDSYNGYTGNGQSSAAMGGGSISFGRGPRYSDHSSTSSYARSSSTGGAVVPGNGGYNLTPTYNNPQQVLTRGTYDDYNRMLTNQTGQSLVGQTGYNISYTASPR